MKLRWVKLHRFQQFIDETIEINPRITIIVGRNDTGKTSFLQRFFDQHFYEGVIHGAARPRVPGFVGDPVSFSLLWEISPADYADFPLAEAFGRDDVRSIQFQFQHRDTPGEQLTYLVNGSPISAYDGVGDGGWPILRKGLEPRLLFPRPYYISVGEGDSLRSIFEARLYELPPDAFEVLRIEDQLSSEALLLRIAGIRAETRPVGGRGIEEPWSSPMIMAPPTMTVEEIEARLETVSERVTRKLRDWWVDPPELTFRVRLPGSADSKQYMQRKNSYAFAWDVTDPSGLALHSSGLHWFVTFLVRLISVEDLGKPFVLLFDEPATPLHPGAQRMITKLLEELTPRHQIICSTHSPFLIDWNFPQRVRLFEKDYGTQRTHVANRPYRREGRRELIWDPLRDSIGVSMGDMLIVNDTNILVEGTSDQILLANISAALESAGRRHVDLRRVSIIPYNEEPALPYIIAKARANSGRVVVLADGDDQGRKVARYCAQGHIPCVSVGAAIRSGADAGIEDLIGIDAYHQVSSASFRAVGVRASFVTRRCPDALVVPFSLSERGRRGKGLSRIDHKHHERA